MERTNVEPTTSKDLILILLRYAGSLGLDADRICEASGFDLRASDENDRFSVRRFNTIWEEIVRCSGDHDFGLHLGEAVRNFVGGHLLYGVMMNAPTLGDAIEKFCRYHSILADAAQPRLHPEDEFARLLLITPYPRYAPRRHHAEFILSLFASFLTTLIDNRRHFREVRFRHPAPADTSEHRRIFGTKILFNCAENELLIKKTDLSAPVFLANPILLETLESMARKLMDRLYSSRLWTDRVARLQSGLLLKGDRPMIERVAGELAVSPRQLQIRLKEEGITYQKLLDRVREEIALDCLNGGDHTLADIAFLLGFSEQSGFNHAFKRWTGKTPGEYRDRTLGNIK